MVGLITLVVIDGDSLARTLSVVGLTTSMVANGDSLAGTLFMVLQWQQMEIHEQKPCLWWG
jgi:hypothetical protein